MTLEERNGLCGNPVVIHHHVVETSTGSHLQRQAMGWVHLTQVGHGTVDARQPTLQNQAQRRRATAFLQGFAAAFQLGQVLLQPHLILFQPLAAALQQPQGAVAFVALRPERLQHLLELRLPGSQVIQPGLVLPVAGFPLLLLLTPILQLLLLLLEPLLKLELFGAQGLDAGAQRRHVLLPLLIGL